MIYTKHKTQTKILAATNYWRRQNIGDDKILAPPEMFALTENICVDKILALTKCWRRQNTRDDKIFAMTKFSRRQNTRVNKILAWTKCWRRRRSISLLFGPEESTAADFSQTSLMFSHVSQKMLIPPHAVAKCAVATGGPTFMGRLSPALYRPIVLAHHAENVKNIDVCQYFTDFRQTIEVNISAHRCTTKKLVKNKKLSPPCPILVYILIPSK
jgi:hypothetical protein